MISPLSRRQFVTTTAALAASAFVPRRLFAAAPSGTQRIVIRTDSEIGTVRPEFHGHFIEHLGSCVYGGLWVGKDSHIPNLNGYRKQAVEYLQELGVPVLRWPGGCFADDYHWRDGIGPAAKRPKRVNIHWGEYVEDNSFGTHEFIGLCRLLNAEPYFAGNVGSSTPHELRDWIEYCNYPSGSTLSDERAANGSAEPFRVRYWGVGNESWGCGGNMRPEEYARLYRDFAVYCRNFGGTDLFLVASGPSGNDSRWSRGLMDGLGWERPQGVSMHYYSGGADRSTTFTADHMSEQFASYLKVEEAIVQQRAVLDSYQKGKEIGLILDEWGVWDDIPEADERRYGKLWQQSTMRSAIAAGLGLNIFNRQADKLYMCNIAQMVNVLQSLLLTDGPEGEHCVRTTTYHAFSLFKPHRTKTTVRVESGDSSPSGLSVSASKSDKELVVTLVNPRHDVDLQVECTLKGVNPSPGTAQILHDAEWNACNTFDHPDRIVPKPLTLRVDGSQVHLDLPRLSVATAVLPIG
ncbi:Intracellular exo-alpha-L-arabinofuranosidase [Candidatus Sulfotelmatobacter kueseliae]|uniref:non-reducing end alpha-L-arabinofuranosidase n=1 Tax=Candidatus Sulfotelmatobacter kueseliae TaxID=2042962 RepID=A0A2U3KWU5_9BACT|nr:Intracellular exo-alpha-L-arabinofuranosidase [Candidatus Sulfotelmatobacter kueseliae]